jgi:hypothetical protein
MAVSGTLHFQVALRLGKEFHVLSTCTQEAVWLKIDVCGGVKKNLSEIEARTKSLT